MKSQIWIGTASLILGMAVSGCGPEEVEPIVGVWKLVSQESRVPGETWRPSDYDDCKSDDTEEYSADGEWILYDGTFHCGEDPTGMLKGTWRMAAAGTKVIYTYDLYAGEYESTVEQLTDTQMILSNATGDLAGTQFRNTYVRVK